MSEPAKQQMGDGQDNFGQAAGKAAQAAKQVSKEAAKQAAAKGVEAGANLIDFSIDRYVDGVIVDRRQYGSLEELTEKELLDPDMDDLYTFTDEQLAKVAIHGLEPAPIATFYSDDERIDIMRHPNGYYYNHYGYDPYHETSASVAGGFDTADEAQQMLLQHRPQAKLQVRYEEIVPVEKQVLAPPAPKPKAKASATVLLPEIPTTQRHNFRIPCMCWVM